MGDGCIPIKKIRGWVEEAGFDGSTKSRYFQIIGGRRTNPLISIKIIKAYQEKS